MSFRRLAQVALLAVVAITLVIVFRPKADVGAVSAVPDDSLTGATWIAYYFHGDVRCDTCRSIEAQAADAVLNGFPAEVANGVLEWQVVNTDQPDNAHFIDDFGLTHGTVVLVERDGGEMQRFTALDRVWELVHDDGDEFRTYVQGELSEWMRSGS